MPRSRGGNSVVADDDAATVDRDAHAAEHVGIASTAPPAWSSTAVYDEGDVVTYDGAVWTASWWTKGQEPGSKKNGAGVAGRPSACVVVPAAAAALP
ncbi:hypothetical protein Q9R08_13220 [Microbacterium sp. QXD-8]|uniref:Chitin-binding type-3 domain-containing protein n=1 Tax=Microbacterium psychrotolerans TaxID=3068321 RepID=A0ABU0Z2Y0_9MICO|nr:carbohydrate-binding protein [Microbacterium sp. QXD-8]MDQ7878945.1 hypothetical protein [Microbacterium sp. QXD-8]